MTAASFPVATSNTPLTCLRMLAGPAHVPDDGELLKMVRSSATPMAEGVRSRYRRSERNVLADIHLKLNALGLNSGYSRFSQLLLAFA